MELVGPNEPQNHSKIFVENLSILYFFSSNILENQKYSLFLQTEEMTKRNLTMLVLHDCIDKLSDFKQESGKQFGITKLGIFGSVARNENGEDSDIDIVVEVDHPSLTLMYDLKQSLIRLFGCEVDLVRYRDSLRPMLKSNILNDAVYV